MSLTAAQLSKSEERLARLVRLCRALPEVADDAWGQGHHVFKVGKKSFGYHLLDHHGDGRIAFCVKSTKTEQRSLVRDDPERFYVPAYLGPAGWVSVRLDLATVDWEVVWDLAEAGWLHVAPKRLAARLERGEEDPR